MANSTFGYDFSVKKYATKEDVSTELDIYNVDGIWKDDILSYREQFKSETSLKDIAGFNFNFYLTDLLINNEQLFNSKFDKLYESASGLPLSSPNEYSARYKMRKLQLRRVSSFLRLNASEVALDNILNNAPIDISYRPLKNYYNALMFFEEHSDLEVNEDLLGTYLSLLRGTDEITTFYRTSAFIDETSAKAYRAMLNNEYNGMPSQDIEGMMSALFEFINNDTLSIGAKLAAILFEFIYIKPFYDNNELVALFLMKHFLMKMGAKRYINLIPFEILLSDNQDRFKTLQKETTKNRDLTYIYDYFLTNSLAAIQEVIDTIIRQEVKMSEVTYYKGDDTEQIELEFGPSEEKPVYTEMTKDDVINEELKETYIEKTTPKVKKTELITKKAKEEKVTKEPSKDERILNREAREMLESDPYISPKQAHFFVRHCTPNKFYTIQQFKKFEGVVYETARTSMDNLAKRGYYRREQVKNKFVYTPIIEK